MDLQDVLHRLKVHLFGAESSPSCASFALLELKEIEIKEELEQRVVELVDTEAVDLWESCKSGVLKACDALCGKTKGRRDQGNTWWWNEQVTKAINRKKKHLIRGTRITHRKIKNNYRKARNQTKKVVAKAMQKVAKVEEEMKVLCDKPNKVFKLVKFMRKDGKDIQMVEVARRIKMGDL